MQAAASAKAAGRDHTVMTHGQAMAFYASSSISDPQTGRVILLPVYMQDTNVMVAGHIRSVRTVKVRVPTQLLARIPFTTSRYVDATANRTVNPYGSVNNYTCDTSYSWCVTLTMPYNWYPDGNDNCYAVASPGYTSQWTREDNSVFLQNTTMNLGVASGPQCGGAYYKHDNHSISPGNGSSFTYWPSWGSRYADTSQAFSQIVGSYQCANIDTDLVRYGSKWHWTMFVGFGTTCMR